MADEKKNMEIWNLLKDTDPKIVTSVKGGKLEKLGFSQIDPMGRKLKLTEVFGAVGIGWNYRVVRCDWTQVGSDVLNSVEVLFQFKWNGEWSKEFSGAGATFVSKQGDETFKSSVTDALMNATVAAGLSADVYMGRFDGSKYNKVDGSTMNTNSEKPKPTTKTAAPAAPSKPAPAPQPKQEQPQTIAPAQPEQNATSDSPTPEQMRKIVTDYVNANENTRKNMLICFKRNRVEDMTDAEIESAYKNFKKTNRI